MVLAALALICILLAMLDLITGTIPANPLLWFILGMIFFGGYLLMDRRR